jgi:dihydrofolate reductase
MTISLDGFVNDRAGGVSALYPDFDALHATEPMQEAMQNTGAVVMGRHAFAMAEDPDWYAGNYEFQVPIFVLTHRTPDKHPRETGALTFTFATDGIGSAIHQARAAAADRDVTVIGGASTAQQCLQAGLADELHIDIMPVLLCAGQRFFDGIGPGQIQLERLVVLVLPAGRTHLRYSLAKPENRE